MNTFDPVKHQYFLNDRPVPSVTSVLQDLLPCWKAAPWYLTRGQAVHACAALIARGKNFTNAPEIDGQVAALREFYAEVKPVVIDVERKVYSVRSQFAGTLDLLTVKPGSERLMIIDYKATLTPSVPFQCAAYALAIEDQMARVVKWGCGVEIRENGTYQMGAIIDLTIYKRKFLELLGAFNSRRECKIKQEVRE